MIGARLPRRFWVALAVLLAFGAFQFQYGDTIGSPEQAEQLVRQHPYLFDQPNQANAVSTVTCSKTEESLWTRFLRLSRLRSPGPGTFYDCTGSYSTGDPGRWCVHFRVRPDTNSPDTSPIVTVLGSTGSCPL